MVPPERWTKPVVLRRLSGTRDARVLVLVFSSPYSLDCVVCPVEVTPVGRGRLGSDGYRVLSGRLSSPWRAAPCFRLVTGIVS